MELLELMRSESKPTWMPIGLHAHFGGVVQAMTQNKMRSSIHYEDNLLIWRKEELLGQKLGEIVSQN